MASTVTTRLRLEKQGSGENSNTWGTRLNGNTIDMVDEAFGVSAFTLSGSKTLTANNYTTDESRPMVLDITSGTGGTVTIPNVQKAYLVRNATSGSVTFTTGSGTTASVATGEIQWIFSAGGNVVRASNWFNQSGISAFMLTVLDDANAGAARTTLGAAASGANTDITTATGLTGLNTSITLNESGTISASTLGYRGLPTKQTGGGLTLALTDAGGVIRLTSGNLTIPANASIAFPVGTTIVVANRSGAARTIAITTDTLYLAGVGTTGTRTLADFGVATLIKDTSTQWLISGTGVT